MSKPSSAKSFARWIAANGGEVLKPTSQYEFARFRAEGDLCIIYRNNFGALSSFQGEICREAYDAWQARKALDLSPPAPSPAVRLDTNKARAEAIGAIVEVRARRLPFISIRSFARENRLTVRVLAKLGCIHGLERRGHRLFRPLTLERS